MDHIAIDIGASSGRLIMGRVIDDKLILKEIHRFPNGFETRGGSCFWDMDTLLKEIIHGLEIAKKEGCLRCTAAIDTWGVDYALIGAAGGRIREVIAYRDDRTKDTMEKVFCEISRSGIYRKTGIQFLPFNTLYQLYEEDQETFERTEKILLVPDYLAYRLTGIMVGEKTNWSTAQLLNPATGDFDEHLLEVAGVRRDQLPELVNAGTELGVLSDEWTGSHDLPFCSVFTTASHDTASAVAGTPLPNDNWVYISSGTWSLIGIETDRAIISDESFKRNYTNEWGVFGTFRFLKNIMGLWVIQELRRHLPKEYSFAELAELAKNSDYECPYINFNGERFLNPDNMITEIQDACRETGQNVPEGAGELAKTVYQNLALLYGEAVEDIERITGKTVEGICIVGGGSKNEFLNQLTADFCGKPVLAGLTEATAAGNIVVQMIAQGDLDNLAEARELVRRSFEIKRYEPSRTDSKKFLDQFKLQAGE